MPITSRTPAEFLRIAAADGRVLEGLLYEPRGTVAIASVLYLHGKGGNCYSGPSWFVPTLGQAAPIRHLALNMRCHDLGYTRYDVPFVDVSVGHAKVDGGCWEDLALGTLDVAAGVDALRSCGPEPVFVTGHSSGGFYTAACDAALGVAGRVLLSPLTSNKRPLQAWFGDEDGLQAAIHTAQTMVADGVGDRLLRLATWYYAISATSLLERVSEPDDAWLAAMRADDSPVLLVCGSAESRVPLWRELLDALPAQDKMMVTIPHSDHSYVGHEVAVTQAVVDFIVARARAVRSDGEAQRPPE